MAVAVVVCIVTGALLGCPWSGGASNGAKAAFSAFPREGDAPLSVSFAAEVTGLTANAAKFRNTEPPVPLTVKSYAWDFGDGATATKERIVHTYRAPGHYGVTLSVTLSDGSVLRHTEADCIVVNGAGENHAPVANAGTDQNAVIGVPVQLDGSGSSDPDGDSLVYGWQVTGAPEGSVAAIVGPTTQRPSFTPDRVGTYTIRLTVNDGTLNSVPDTMTITARAAENRPPTANAGPDREVTTGNLVQLNGAQSTDPDGDPLTYAWSFVSRPTGSQATLANATQVSPSFTADVAGAYVIQLTVNDGQVSSLPDTMTVTAGGTANRAPTASAGPDQTIETGATVHLDGSGSTDPDGNPLTYHWQFTSFPGQSAPALSDAAAAAPTFVAATAGVYVAQLVVNDGALDSQPDTVTITAGEEQNTAPVANAGPDQAATQGATVHLNGAASHDAESDPLTYLWSFASRPVGSSAVLSSPSAVAPTFTADLVGTYVVQLIVNDGHVDSDPDTVSITVTTAPANTAPVAYAGIDRTVYVSASVTLDGTGSQDADGDTLTYHWAFLTRPQGSSAQFGDATASRPSFTADRAGTYVAQLVVNDGEVDSTPSTVTIVARVANAPQVHVPALAYSVQQGETLRIAVTGDDPDVELVTLAATPSIGNAYFKSTPGVDATGTFIFSPTSEQKGSFAVAFMARDPLGLTDSKTVQITVRAENHAPTLTVPATATVNEGAILNVALTATDSDGDVLTLTAQPLPANAVFLPSTGTIVFAPTYEQAGEYTVTCESSDGTLSSGPRTVVITVTDVPVGETGQPSDLVLNVNDAESPSLLKNARITGSVNATLDPPALPAATSGLITGMDPATGEQGQTLNVTLTGQSSSKAAFATHFASGVSVADFGTGITVNSTRVSSATSIVANITIGSTADRGPRAVTVQTRDETAVSIPAFNVVRGRANVTGTVLDPETGRPLVGAIVTCEGSSIFAVTDENGVFTLRDVPTGTLRLLVAAQNHELIHLDVTTTPGGTTDAGSTSPRPIVADPTAPARVSLFSVLSRDFADVSGGKGLDETRRLVTDALLLVGGSEMGVLDEYGNQTNPEVQGNGLFSVAQTGVRMLAQRMQRGGETVALADLLFAFSYGFTWSTGVPISLQEWMDGLQDAVNRAWADPNAPENQIAILIFNRGRDVLLNPPTLTPDMRLNPLQAFLLTTSQWVYVADENATAKDKAEQASLPKSARPAGTKAARKVTSFWRGFYSLRSSKLVGPTGRSNIADRAFLNYCMYTCTMCMPMPGLVGFMSNMAATAPYAGVVMSDMIGAFGFSALAAAQPEPPLASTITHSVVHAQDGSVVVDISFKPSPSQARQTSAADPRFLYTLYRFSTFDAPREVVAHQVITYETEVPVNESGATIYRPVAELTETQWHNLMPLTLRDTKPLPLVEGAGGQMQPALAATWYYAITLTRMDDPSQKIDQRLLDNAQPWWTLSTTSSLASLEPFVLHTRKMLVSDYSAAEVVSVTASGEAAKVEEIEVDPRNGDVYYSDTSGSAQYAYPDQPKFIKIDKSGTGDHTIYATSGFKDPGHTGLAIDSSGNLYTDNAASDEQYGGRLFQYAQPNASKSYVGSVNYFSLELMFANPVSTGPMAMGPGANKDVSPEDLYMVERLSNSVRRAAVQTPLNAPLRRVVAQPWAQLPFQAETLDLEVLADGNGDLLVHNVGGDALTANLVLSDGHLMPHRKFKVTLTVTNPTSQAITGVTPLPLTIANADLVTRLSGPTPMTTDLAAFGSVDFVYEYETVSSGTAVFQGQAQGMEPEGSTLSTLLVPPDGNSLDIGSPLRVERIEAKPEQVAPGETITVRALVVNEGNTDFRDVRAECVAVPVPELPGQVTAGSGPSPSSTSLAAGANTWFEWTYTADEYGKVVFDVRVSGVEVESGESAATVFLPSAPVLITPMLVTLKADPVSVLLRDTETVSMELAVENRGGVTLTSVAPALRQADGKGRFAEQQEVDVAPVDLSAGGKHTFKYTLAKPSAAGEMTYEGSVTATGASGKAVPSTAATTKVYIGPRIHGTVYDVVLSFSGDRTALVEDRYMIQGPITVKARPYPFLLDSGPTYEGTLQNGTFDIAVPKYDLYEVQAEIPLSIPGRTGTQPSIGFSEKVYLLSGDVAELKVMVPKSLLETAFVQVDGLNRVDVAAGRWPIFGAPISVPVSYSRVKWDYDQFLTTTFCRGVLTPRYESSYVEGGWRTPIAWDAVPRLAQLLNFSKTRLNEVAATVVTTIKSILPAVWASETGKAYLDKCTFSYSDGSNPLIDSAFVREQNAGKWIYRNQWGVDMRLGESDVMRDFMLAIESSVSTLIGTMVPPGSDREELVGRTTFAVDWVTRIVWFFWTLRGLDDLAKQSAEVAAIKVATELLVQPFYIDLITEPMLRDAVKVAQQPHLITGSTRAVLDAIYAFDQKLQAEQSQRSAQTSAALSAWGGADSFNDLMTGVMGYAKACDYSIAELGGFGTECVLAAPKIKAGMTWLLLLDALNSIYVMTLLEPGHVSVASKKAMDFNLPVSLDNMGGLSCLLGKADKPITASGSKGTDAAKAALPALFPLKPPGSAKAAPGAAKSFSEVTAYENAVNTFLPILRSGDRQNVEDHLTAFIAAHQAVSNALVTAGERALAGQNQLATDDPLRDTLYDMRTALDDSRLKRDMVVVILAGVISLNENVSYLQKAADALPDALAATQEAAGLLAPVKDRLEGIMIPGALSMKAAAALSAAPGATVPVDVTLRNIGDEPAKQITLTVVRNDARGTQRDSVPLNDLAPGASLSYSVVETLPDTEGPMSVVVTAELAGKPSVAESLVVRARSAKR